MSHPSGSPLARALLVATGAVAGSLGTLTVQHLAGSADSGAAVSAPENQTSPARTTALHRRAGDAAVKLSQILTADDREHKSADLHRLGQETAGTSEAAALKLAAEISGESDRNDFLRGVVSGMAERDAAGAARLSLTQFTPGALQAEALRIALGKWGGDHPRDAYAWAMDNLNGPVKEEAINALVSNWAARSPGQASRWFVETGSTSQPLLAALISGWAGKSPREAAQWVETLPDRTNRDAGRLIAAREWAAQNPQEAAANYSTPSPDLAGVLADIWGTNNPAAASRWIGQLPAGPAREEAAGTLAAVWAASDVNAAAQWADGLRDETTRAAAVEHLATTWGAIDPDKAIAWLGTQPAGLRERALTGAYNSWAGTDPEGLEEWIRELRDSTQTDIARRSLAEVRMAEDPAAALDLTLNMSPVAQPDAVGRYFRAWRRTDDAAAQEWLQQHWGELSHSVQVRIEREQQRGMR